MTPQELEGSGRGTSMIASRRGIEEAILYQRVKGISNVALSLPVPGRPSPAVGHLAATLVIGARFERREGGDQGFIVAAHVGHNHGVARRQILRFLWVFPQVKQLPAVGTFDQTPILPADLVQIASRRVGRIGVVPEEVSWTSPCRLP